ncbi:MAG: hypothetical protein JWR19_4568 [Pedosphaera sp.]|nr:hypothetical protein [Pedosphaera sp.]
MSLINEALKRAKEAEAGNRSSASPAARPMEAAHSPDSGGYWLPILMGVVLLVSGVLMWQWLGSGGAMQVRARSNPAPTTPAVAVPVSSVAAVPVATPTIGVSSNTVAVAATTDVEATNTVTVAEAKPQPVTYKLQSVFFRPNNPEAVINGKLVFIGSRVGDARVVAIAREAATVVTSAGQTNVLELP